MKKSKNMVIKLLLVGSLTVSSTPVSIFANTQSNNFGLRTTITQNLNCANMVNYVNIKEIKEIVQEIEIVKLKSSEITLENLNILAKQKLEKAYMQNKANIKRTESIKDKLNEFEKKVFDSNPYCGFYALLDGQYAIDSTKACFNANWGYHNDNADAYRHSLWNALMAYHCGSSFAKQFADAHEKGTPNPPLESKMDFSNNEKGRSIGSGNIPKSTNQMAIVDYISGKVLSAVKNGEMLRYCGDDIGELKYLTKTNKSGALK